MQLFIRLLIWTNRLPALPHGLVVYPPLLPSSTRPPVQCRCLPALPYTAVRRLPALPYTAVVYPPSRTLLSSTGARLEDGVVGLQPVGALAGEHGVEDGVVALQTEVAGAGERPVPVDPTKALLQWLAALSRHRLTVCPTQAPACTHTANTRQHRRD